jgi:hypothetical protein
VRLIFPEAFAAISLQFNALRPISHPGLRPNLPFSGLNQERCK